MLTFCSESLYVITRNSIPYTFNGNITNAPKLEHSKKVYINAPFLSPVLYKKVKGHPCDTTYPPLPNAHTHMPMNSNTLHLAFVLPLAGAVSLPL